MSAIGSYVRVRTADLARCVELASQATADRPFRWPWQPRVESGRERFDREWEAAVLQEVVFDGSGYVFGSYFLAQNAVNQLEDLFAAGDGRILANVFTAAWPVRSPLSLPDIDEGAVRRFCADEWGDEASAMFEAVMKAHGFFKQGLARVTRDEAVVFIIS